MPEYDGLAIFKANEPIIELLTSRGALLARKDLHHSYPHCWRCHKPVIFRATEQWFIRMETPMQNADGSATTFRERALNEIKKVKWDPAWGQERISNMIATRPDWCISRQRIWGVPIAVFLCKQCRKPLLSPEAHRRVVALFEQEGADAWYTRPVSDFLPADTACPHCGATEFDKEFDILDVWFESGASQAAVLGEQAGFGLPWPADLYLEGGDQHRGWFHSSLLCAVGIQNAAPYRSVATCGWTLDEQGRALSKSLGNNVDPVQIAEQLGGDIIRLWVASVDFREDVVASVPLMKRLAEEIYRKLRNTFRFLLGNLHGFDPALHAVPFEQMEPLDQYMLARTAELTANVRDWYDAMEFHRVYHAINQFCVSDLSAVYLDVLKDRMYTFAPSNPQRRSAQTAIWKITEALVRLIAPILSFTAEEIWQYLPKIEGRESSVHIAHFPKPEDLAQNTAALLADWTQIFAARNEVLKSLEEARKEKHIGKALEAKVVLQVPSPLEAVLVQYAASLKELFNVSQVEMNIVPVTTGASLAIIATTLPADGSKCERCWNYSTRVGESKEWPTLCERCLAALAEMNFTPETNTKRSEMNAEPKKTRDWRLPLLLISVAVFVADRITKTLILLHLKPSDVIAVIPGWFHLTHVYNNGAAWSLFEDTRSPEKVRWLLIAFSVFAISVVFALFWNVGKRLSMTSVALAMILGGAMGNLYDRLAYHFVIDFLAFSHWGYHYPDFNIADSCIVIGACLLLLEAILGPNQLFADPQPPQPQPPQSPQP